MKSISLLIVSCTLLIACAKHSDPSFDYVGQYKKDTAAISGYLKSNNVSATKLSEGIWFKIDAPATGIRPTYSDSIYVSYTMKLLSDNSIVDQSSTPLFSLLSNFIAGLQIAMPQFQRGSHGRIFIPSYYAYQNQSSAALPANSNLIFEFTLSDVRDYQLKKDTAIIGSFLRGHEISPVIIDPSGLRYTIDVDGTGIKPSLTDSVIVTYNSRLLAGGSVIETSNTHKILVSDWFIGLSIGLVNIKEGSTATFYVPSSLAGGPYYNGKYSIPASSNLIYNLQLTKVIHH